MSGCLKSRGEAAYSVVRPISRFSRWRARVPSDFGVLLRAVAIDRNVSVQNQLIPNLVGQIVEKIRIIAGPTPNYGVCDVVELWLMKHPNCDVLLRRRASNLSGHSNSKTTLCARFEIATPYRPDCSMNLF